MVDSSLLEQARTQVSRGDPARALPLLDELIALDPSRAEPWFLRGAAHHRMGQLAPARQDLQRASQLDAVNLQVWFALAAVCLELGDVPIAQSACQSALALAPGNADPWFSLGVCQERNGDVDDALSSYARVLQLDRKHQGALKNRLGLLRVQGRIGEAYECARAYASAYPYSSDAQFSLGETCLQAGENAKAVAAFGRAVQLAPKNPRFVLHEGFALAMSERFADAQRCLDRAAAMDPELIRQYRASIFNERSASPVARLDARALFLLRHYDRIECCDWADRTYFLQRFVELIDEGAATSPLSERALGFRAMAMGVDLRVQRSLATQLAAALVAEPVSPRAVADSAQGRRLRVGYVSPDFRMHPIGLMTSRLYGWHDRSRFEVHCYALGGNDGSAIRRTIERESEHFVLLDDLPDAEAAQRIADDGIDVLVDLAGYTESSRPGIFARRPAPVQISWLGYSATMGAPWIDYLIADDVCVPPEHETGYSEALLRMPAGQYLCSYAADPLSPPPTRADAGLPENARVLAALHAHYKIDPEVFVLWMRLLQRHPDTVLWLLAPNAETSRRLLQVAREMCVDPGRLVFAPKVPHAQHLARLQHAVLMLDTPQCNGSTTVCDALVAGVPVVSCLGATLAQRMGGSVIHAAELSQWLVEDLTAYEQRADELLRDSALLSAARQSLAEARTGALFFRPRDWARHLEAGYIEVWRRHVAGEAPCAIRVFA